MPTIARTVRVIVAVMRMICEVRTFSRCLQQVASARVPAQSCPNLPRSLLTRCAAKRIIARAGL